MLLHAQLLRPTAHSATCRVLLLLLHSKIEMTEEKSQWWKDFSIRKSSEHNTADTYKHHTKCYTSIWKCPPLHPVWVFLYTWKLNCDIALHSALPVFPKHFHDLFTSKHGLNSTMLTSAMHNHWHSSTDKCSSKLHCCKFQFNCGREWSRIKFLCDKLPRDYTTRLSHLTGTCVDKGKLWAWQKIVQEWQVKWSVLVSHFVGWVILCHALNYT